MIITRLEFIQIIDYLTALRKLIHDLYDRIFGREV